MENQRSVSILFLLGGAVVGYFMRSLTRTLMGNFVLEDQLLGGFLPVSALVGIVVAVASFFVLLRNERASTFTDSVVSELRGVTWPTREETVGNTTVVVGATVFFSLLLAFYDFTWAKITEIFLFSPG